MTTAKSYLDCRSVAYDRGVPLKLSISNKDKTTLIPLNVQILPQQ